MIYSEKTLTRKASANVTGTGANYRLEYIVRNEPTKPVDSITATISQVTVTKVNNVDTETLTRVGSACVDVTSNRNYLAIDKNKEVSMANQAKIAAQYFIDVAAVLAEPIV